jgi:hypothetical protein
MKIHTNLTTESINTYDLKNMISVLRKAIRNDGHYGHYIASDKEELEELSCFFGSVMNAIDSTLEQEYKKSNKG